MTWTARLRMFCCWLRTGHHYLVIHRDGRMRLGCLCGKETAGWVIGSSWDDTER